MSDLHDRLKAALSARYELERELGRGGMAVVYLARDVKQGRQVALKVFQPDVAAAMGPKRFRREVEIATRLEHPHILSLYDSGEAEGLLYYVMPYVEEESLRSRLDREGQLPIEDALRIAREMAEALDYAHDQGVVHRDVKPGNVLLQRGHALLADFGVARALEASGAEKLTGTGVSVGTPQYMAPEQVTGADTVDGRADVYAVGAVLYEMLTGEAPYTGSTPQAILAKRMAGPPTPIPVLRETVGPDIDGIVQQAMSRSAADRWQSAGALAKALSAAERGGGTPIPGLSTWPGVTGEITAVGAKSRRGRWSIGAAALVVAAVATGGWYLTRGADGTGQVAADLPEPDPMLVLVVPERPSDTREWTWTGILGDRIKRLGDLRIVDRTEAEATLASTDILPTSSADSMAAGWAAGRFVMVGASQIGDEIRLNLRLYSTGDPGNLRAEVDTTVSELDHDSWAPAVVVRLFENQERALTSQANLAELNTGSANAAAEIWASRGTGYWARGQYDSATIAYQNAVRIDSTYVEAWKGLLWAAGFSTPIELPIDHDSVVAHRELAQLARDRLRSLDVDSAVAPRLTLREARRAAATSPGNAQAQWQLYEAMLREYWKRGWEPDSVLVPLLKSIELDPHAAYNRFRLLVYYMYVGDAAAMQRTFDEIQDTEVSGLPVLPVFPAIFTIALGSSPQQTDSVLAALTPNSELANIVMHRLLLVQDDMELVSRIAPIAANPPSWSAFWQVYAALSGGQWLEAIDLIERDEQLADHARAQFAYLVRVRAGMAAAGVLDLAENEIRALRDSTRDAAADGTIRVAQRLHRLGLMSSRLGEHSAARAFADSLNVLSRQAPDSRPEDPGPKLTREEFAELASDAALEVLALDASLRGKPEEALTYLERQEFEAIPSFERGEYHWITARTYGRFLRAEILSALGRYEEAAGWYATIPRVSMGFHLGHLLYAPVFRGRARALDALGRHEEALHYYRRFVTRWQDADPHLQPQVEEARQRIRELEAELD